MQGQDVVATPNMAWPAGQDDLDSRSRSYTTIINQYDMLDRNEEQRLARQWHEFHDRSATDALVTSHLRLARSIARQYKGYGLPFADLVAEANLGLVIAASRFEPDHDARFSSYAMWWIKANIHQYILHSWSLVKIGTTAAQKKLFFRLRSETRKLASDPTRLTPETVVAIAHNLQVTPHDVIEMDVRMNRDLSLNNKIRQDDQTTEWEDMLVDQSPGVEETFADRDETTRRSEALREALGVLTPRERYVFVSRRMAEQPLSREQLGCELRVSIERVRQIENCAFTKVKRAVVLAMKQGPRGRH